MSTTRVQVTGLRELEARLVALPRELRKGPIMTALRKAGRVVQADAKRRVPKRTGALGDNIIVARKRTKDPTKQSVQVTIRAKAKKYADNARNRKQGRVGGKYADIGPLFYGRFIELGAGPSAKRPWVTPAQPFLRPAFEENAAQLPEVFREALAAQIDKVVVKLGGRAR